MKNTQTRLLLIIMAVMLLLTGCKQEINQGAMGSEIWEEMPEFTYGIIESEKLETQQWNSGRCEAVSDNFMAETENGYYWGFGNILYYADKTNPETWVFVCSQADCMHGDRKQCLAYIETGYFVIKNDRIHFLESSGLYPQLYDKEKNTELLLSMNADGTDKQIAYAIEDAVLTDAGSFSFFLTDEHWINLISAFQTDGSVVTRLFRVTEEGVSEIPIADSNGSASHYIRSGRSNRLHGDKVFWCSALNNAPGMYYRFVDDVLQQVDLTGLELFGAYLSGNTLRCFRPSDGYYDVNLQTREETKTADAQSNSSYAEILLPNCIIESTLLGWNSLKSRASNMDHTMKLFDGQQWYDVKLPESLLNAPDSCYLICQSVTSNAIFLYSQDDANPLITSVYCIYLNTETPELLYCGDLPYPITEEDETEPAQKP